MKRLVQQDYKFSGNEVEEVQQNYQLADNEVE